jgi:hypothetical protein
LLDRHGMSFETPALPWGDAAGDVSKGPAPQDDVIS